jgi:DNA-binding HxlR family transcriptional regulator
MANYRQYCPVARAAEIFADRWTPLIVRELLAGSCHFNGIERGLPGISRSLLASRLRQLEDAGVVERREGRGSKSVEYHLTDAGRDLKAVVDSLGAWGVRWAFGEPKPEELDPVLLLWKMHRRVRRDLLPPSRVVVEFEFTGRGKRRLWLILQPHDVSVCLKPPGFDPDIVVHAELAFFYRIWLGYIDYDTAIRSRRLVVDGPRTLTRDFPKWFTWSPMAQLVRAERNREEAVGKAAS